MISHGYRRLGGAGEKALSLGLDGWNGWGWGVDAEREYAFCGEVPDGGKRLRKQLVDEVEVGAAEKSELMDS